MLRPQSQRFTELKDYKKFVVESSDVIEDLRVYVKEEGSERVFWYKERFLTDDEIVENVVENATSRVCWTIHRPKRGWYIRIRAPAFPLGVAIPLAPLPASSPFYNTDAGLTLSTRINPGRRRSNVGVLGASGSRVSSPPTYSSKVSVDTERGSGDTVVHSYPPTPSLIASKALGQPPSPDTVRAKLDQVSADRGSRVVNEPPVVKQFLLAPHSSFSSSSSHVHPEEQRNSSLIARALSIFRNSKPSHSLSFTLCPLSGSEGGASLSASVETSQQQQQHQGQQQQLGENDDHSRRHSILRIGELLPPSPPCLITFHDRSPAWSLGTLSGVLEVDTAMEREFGVDRSFWVTVALAYMEFLVERESYLAAAGG